MHRKSVWGALLAGVLALSSTGLALELGDEAPPLKIDKWIKGGPVDLKDGQGKSIYVIDFWATWCGPCKKSIPHLTEIQKKYKDKGVVVIGVSLDSDKGGPRATRSHVPGFVEKQGDDMDYVVGLDTKDLDTAKTYLEPFLADGIPAAFIIDKAGKLAFFGMGYPMDGFDKALEEIVAGKYDLKAAQAADKERREEAEKEREKALHELKVQQAVEHYIELASDEDTKRADLQKAGQEALALIGEDADTLNSFAWQILDDENIEQRDVKFALKMAKQANDLTKGESAAIVDTYARALWDSGQKAEGLEQQRKAAKLAEKEVKENEGEDKDQAEIQVKEIKGRLAKYEKEMKAGGGGSQPTKGDAEKSGKKDTGEKDTPAKKDKDNGDKEKPENKPSMPGALPVSSAARRSLRKSVVFP